MYYSIRHLTKFLYSNQVSESTMETRMHPRSDQEQRCLTFHLSVSPRCRVSAIVTIWRITSTTSIYRACMGSW